MIAQIVFWSATALVAYVYLGYPVVLVSDAHSTLDNGVLTAAQIAAHHTTTLAHLESFGPRVTPVAAAEVRFAGA